MADIFNDFLKTNSNTVIDIFKIIIPCLLTYFFTSKNLTAPKRREIKQAQFDLVYLPLYLLIKQYKIEDVKDNYPIFIKKVDKIIYKNYQYVYPKTISLYDKFKKQTSTKTPNYFHVSSFIYQIEEDYEKLKIELGYPTNSILNNFRRLNKVDRLLYVSMFAISCLLIYTLSAIYLYIINGDWASVLIGLIAVVIGSLVLYTIVYIKKN